MLTKKERRYYVKVAKQLGYSKDTITRLTQAETENEAIRILRTARERG